ncbi:hypothetical protein PVAND_002118 [Polypedilum vanderplanki]|uniref:Uncharacterized protein n=1 Tax=Polypedilum vanderplanki TaxID=319348 RepID=A0A9J6BRE9_POLVA|nr:hypothetical protein PVAND_002118 [Polypedilum vanderplanki]
MKFLIVVLLIASIHLIDCGKMNKKKEITPRPVTVRTRLDIKDSDIMHFMHIKTKKDGRPVGILVKKTNVLKKQFRPKRNTEDIIEIIGVRERDNEHDKQSIYRNAQIINNTLVKSPYYYRPHKMERSNISKIFH